jgi:hypothetical protein
MVDVITATEIAAMTATVNKPTNQLQRASSNAQGVISSIVIVSRMRTTKSKQSGHINSEEAVAFTTTPANQPTDRTQFFAEIRGAVALLAAPVLQDQHTISVSPKAVTSVVTPSTIDKHKHSTCIDSLPILVLLTSCVVNAKTFLRIRRYQKSQPSNSVSEPSTHRYPHWFITLQH